MIDFKSYSYYTNEVRKKIWSLVRTFDVSDSNVLSAVESFQDMLNSVDALESIVLADIERANEEANKEK